MAERFSTRSLFSVISSPESGSKSSRSSGKSQPNPSSRRRRKPPQDPRNRDAQRNLTPVAQKRKAPPAVSASQPPRNDSPRSRTGTKTRPGTPPPGPRMKRELTPTGQPLTPPLPRTAKTPRRRKTPPLVYATRLLILGVGLAVISGTVLSVFNAAGRSTAMEQPTEEMAGVGLERPSPSASPLPLALPLNQEIAGIKQQIEALVTEYANLTPGVFLVDLDTGGYVSLNGEAALPAASTIKVPILVAFFQAVDEGRVQLDQKLTLRAEHMAGGSGDMQDEIPGREYTALEVATKMIEISDNTATNMLIELLGGAISLNQKFTTWGLTGTVINNNLPDLEGTNTASPKDLVYLLAQVNQGGLVSVKSRDRLLYIMRQTRNDSLLPRGLGEGAIIAHKTGNINSMLADVGLIDMPNGKRYLLAVMVKHSQNNGSAQKLIREISQTVYQYLEGGETVMASPRPATSEP